MQIPMVYASEADVSLASVLMLKDEHAVKCIAVYRADLSGMRSATTLTAPESAALLAISRFCLRSRARVPYQELMPSC